MIIQVKDRRGDIINHRASDELTAKEVLKRFGLETMTCEVWIWPDGRPDLTRKIKDGEMSL